MKTAETPAGIFTINKVKIPSAYTCAAEQKIEYISENHMQIITMDQAVSFGDQILSPRACLENKTIKMEKAEIRG